MPTKFRGVILKGMQLLISLLFFVFLAFGVRSQGVDGAGVEEDPRSILLKSLREDIEPNLPDQDARRLKRNVSRMGSFRQNWVEDAREFLIANASLSELFLYDYSRLRNPRLTNEILNTLLMFETYRYPQAALAFAEDLSENSEGKMLVLRLFRQILGKARPEISKAIVEKVFSEWGQGLPPEERLSVVLRACQSGANFSLEEQGRFSAYARNYPQFWAQFFWEEIRRCFSETRRL